MSEPAVGSPLSMHDPRQVGPWTIHSRLGAGGMGVVFYASSPGFQGAALKVIRPGLLDAPATRDRFRREGAILRSVLQVMSAVDALATLRNVVAALAPGGTLYVVGRMLDDTRLSPLEAVAVNVMFLNVYEDGQAYTESEYRAWFATAGGRACRPRTWVLISG